MARKPRRNFDDSILVALARGESNAATARLSGCSERTVSRRLEDADFRRQLQDVRGQMVSRAIGTLSAAAVDAAETLQGLLKAESDSVRLMAARSLLELLLRFRETDELARRLEELERIAGLSREPVASIENRRLGVSAGGNSDFGVSEGGISDLDDLDEIDATDDGEFPPDVEFQPDVEFENDGGIPLGGENPVEASRPEFHEFEFDTRDAFQ